jgi:hypothetical protein
MSTKTTPMRAGDDDDDHPHDDGHYTRTTIPTAAITPQGETHRAHSSNIGDKNEGERRISDRSEGLSWMVVARLCAV